MILICGGGIIGLSVARELVKRGVDDVLVVEKEFSLGLHASGRNSGVLHAGIYYTPDSFKAQFSIKGNKELKEFCRERNIPIRESGKVIVASCEEEIPTLYEIFSRARKNGAQVELIGEKELSEIEPYAKTFEKAIYSPSTAIVDPSRVIQEIERELEGKVKKGVEFRGVSDGGHAILFDRKEGRTFSVKFDFFVNSAGAFADKVAHSFGVGLRYRVIPFKGTYSKVKKDVVRGNIYPVPDMRNPFLGVHLTKSVYGEIYAGPTAIPAFGRENYGIVKGIDREAPKILFEDTVLFFSNPEFRRVALSEPKKYLKWFFFREVQKLVKGISPEDIMPAKNKVGIRPQVVDWKEKKLVMDFLILKDGNTVHILNAVSPAFTAAFPFARFVVSKYILGESEGTA